MFPMTIASVTAPAPIAPPQSSAPKPPADKTPDANSGAADGTRLPQPTVLPALPPGQGARIDQLV
jgi:hypothetical protein